MDYQSFFREAIESLRTEGRYRVFADIERIAGDFPYAWLYKNGSKEKIVVWCSNDYLAMGQHPLVIQAMHDAIDKCGAGAGGTRNISGTNHYHTTLEFLLASLHQKERALLFTSGYVANDATLYALGRHLPNAVIFSDESNHASMIHGITASRCEKIVFKHNSLSHLKEKLEEVDPKRPKIIAFESLYSMDGDFAPVHEFVNLAKKFDALTYVDEVHAIGVYGKRGAGYVEELGLENDVDIIASNFGKAVGVMGGYIAGSAPFVDFVRSYAPPFIFTTALPPGVAAAAQASIHHFSQSSSERIRLKDVVQKLKNHLKKTGLPFLDHGSHIVPLMIGNATLCKEVTDRLLYEHQIYVQPINYPTVPRGTERLRITPSPCHTDEMIVHFVNALKEVWQFYGLLPKEKMSYPAHG